MFTDIERIIRHATTYDPTVVILGICPTEVKIYLHTKRNPHGSFIHNSPELETIQTSFNR